MSSSITAVEGGNVARSNTSESVSSRPILGRRPSIGLLPLIRIHTLFHSCSAITAIDKKFLPGSGDPPLGDSRTEEQQADLLSAAVYSQQPKIIPALTGGIHLCFPSGYEPVRKFRVQTYTPVWDVAYRLNSDRVAIRHSGPTAH